MQSAYKGESAGNEKEEIVGQVAACKVDHDKRTIQWKKELRKEKKGKQRFLGCAKIQKDDQRPIASWLHKNYTWITSQ